MPKLSSIEKNPPFIEWFELGGLNGYKTLRLENSSCVKIVAAENGTGKTTLLNALYSVLTINIIKLSEIDFRYFSLKLKGVPELVYLKSELFPKRVSYKTTKARDELKDLDVTEQALIRHLSFIYANGLELFSTSDDFNEVYYSTPIGRSELLELYATLVDQRYLSEAAQELAAEIKFALGDLKILYLPTFRRIEAEFSEFSSKREGNVSYRFQDEEESYEEQLIWFGMNDVANKLESFKEKIKSVTFESYSRLSAQSLEALLSPASKRPSFIVDISDEFSSQLNLVLARLGHAGGETEARIYNLIYSGEINQSNYDGLRSHIHQIISIYTNTQAQEQLIEGFVNVVNGYWLLSSSSRNAPPEKEFIFDKFELDVAIRNNQNNEVLELNNLSSGEKQIVAIFAKLYLQQNKKYLILIDEPELSLAMSWQQRFLIDILESPSCAQLVAITHSPFVFDNALDKFAESLIVKYETVL
ncbi:AAA family ATPase [Pseudomonas sp. RL_5y_Pfl2_70]|uniref:AAA family ATPase n=1 Tax=Pseudomonas sp. RL_5y_Pfl2_70 TaxID=3088712 RepID=UPI0030D73C6C